MDAYVRIDLHMAAFCGTRIQEPIANEIVVVLNEYNRSKEIHAFKLVAFFF